MKRALFIVLIAAITACSNPKDTPVPKELTKIGTIKPQLEKLTEEERDLFSQYVVRTTIGSALGAAFGGKEPVGIPNGMTIGKAIEEQKKFISEKQSEETKQKLLKEKL